MNLLLVTEMESCLGNPVGEVGKSCWRGWEILLERLGSPAVEACFPECLHLSISQFPHRIGVVVAVAECCVCHARTSGRLSLPNGGPCSGSTCVGRTPGLGFSHSIFSYSYFQVNNVCFLILIGYVCYLKGSFILSLTEETWMVFVMKPKLGSSQILVARGIYTGLQWEYPQKCKEPLLLTICVYPLECHRIE